MPTAISVENLSKSYLVGHNNAQSEKNTSFRDALAHNTRNLIRKTSDMISGRPIVQGDELEEFWALKDLSFEIQQGERVGFIGHNGAGKSTLLKILSRIAEPTKGRMKITGRVASLLEVGTGFHPELSGRENIFLNGAILGMSRKEIQNKFDQIVDFAEVEQFLDTPVKRYSSGMYVRLAFAVAAHLEPEILIVDEILAVGDAQFQKKCLGKMEDVGREGRTVLFVSHNTNAIEQFCTSCISLEKGCLIENSSDIRKVITNYLFKEDKIKRSSTWINTDNEFSNPWFQPLSCIITDDFSNPLKMPLVNNQNFWVEIEVEIKEIDSSLTFGYALYSEDGQLLYWSYPTDIREENWIPVKLGISKWRSRIPSHFLNEGSYRLEVLGSLHFREWICGPGNKAPHIEFQIIGGLSESPYWLSRRPGILAPIMNWDAT